MVTLTLYRHQDSRLRPNFSSAKGLAKG